MATQIDHTVSQGAPQVGAGGQVNNGDGLSQISAGPAALAQLMIYEVMALYAKIISLDQEQKQSMIKAQSSEVKGEAKATVDAGWAYGATMIAAGALAIVGAAAGLALVMAPAMTGKMKVQNAELGKIDAEMKPIDNLSKIEKLTAPAPAAVGTTDAGVRARMTELKQGQYAPGVGSQGTNMSQEETDQQALAELKRTEPEAYTAYTEARRGDLERLTRRQNSVASDRLSNGQMHQTWSSTATVAFKGVGDGAQGYGSGKKGEHDATAALNRTAGSMSGSQAGELGSAASKAVDAQGAQNQIFEKMVQASSVQA